MLCTHTYAHVSKKDKHEVNDESYFPQGIFIRGVTYKNIL